MARIERTHTKPRNETAAVPEIQGAAKHGNSKARPIITGTAAPKLKVYHSKPHAGEPGSYPGYESGLAADNLGNDLTAADRQD